MGIWNWPLRGFVTVRWYFTGLACHQKGHSLGNLLSLGNPGAVIALKRWINRTAYRLHSCAIVEQPESAQSVPIALHSIPQQGCRTGSLCNQRLHPRAIAANRLPLRR